MACVCRPPALIQLMHTLTLSIPSFIKLSSKQWCPHPDNISSLIDWHMAYDSGWVLTSPTSVTFQFVCLYNSIYIHSNCIAIVCVYIYCWVLFYAFCSFIHLYVLWELQHCMLKLQHCVWELHYCMLKLHNYHYVSTMYRPSALLYNCIYVQAMCLYARVPRRQSLLGTYFMAPYFNILMTSHLCDVMSVCHVCVYRRSVRIWIGHCMIELHHFMLELHNCLLKLQQFC